MGLVEVECHPRCHDVALYGTPVAGDLTALALEVTRDRRSWAKVHVSPSYTYVPSYGGVQVNVPELGANVAVDGAHDLHVPETSVDISPHLAAYEDVAEPGMHVVLYQPAYLEVTGTGRNIVLDSLRTHNDVADEPLLGRVCGKRQEHEETEDHGGDRE
jgi:hypothetical protein